MEMVCIFPFICNIKNWSQWSSTWNGSSLRYCSGVLCPSFRTKMNLDICKAADKCGTIPLSRAVGVSHSFCMVLRRWGRNSSEACNDVCPISKNSHGNLCFNINELDR